MLSDELKLARWREAQAQHPDLSLKRSPKAKKAAPIGALISVRDVTNDFLVQAKYLKALQLLEQRDSKIAELEDKLESARSRV